MRGRSYTADNWKDTMHENIILIDMFWLVSWSVNEHGAVYQRQHFEMD